MIVPEGGGRYAFAHALVRETLYAALSPLARERLHRAAAEAIERVHVDHLEDHLAALAAHWARAGGGPEEQAKAFIYARWGGDHSLARFAYEEAARSYEQALAVLAAHPRADLRMQCELWLTLADARMRASDVNGERTACVRAAALARELGDAELFGRAALGFGWTFSHMGSDPGADRAPGGVAAPPAGRDHRPARPPDGPPRAGAVLAPRHVAAPARVERRGGGHGARAR